MSNDTPDYIRFENNPTNWLFFFIRFLLFTNLVGLIFSYLGDKELNVSTFVLFSIIALGFTLYIYLNKIIKIEYKKNCLIIFYEYKSYSDDLFSFSITEKSKKTRSLSKYKQMVLTSRNIKRTIRLESGVFEDYDNFRKFLINKKVLGNSNE